MGLSLACPVPGPSLCSSPQTLFSLLPLQALRAPGTQGVPSLPAAGAGQHRPCGRTPFLTLALCRGADGSSGVGSHSFLGASPLGPQWLARACTVLFGWDTWFCKKLKKKMLRLPCACVFLERPAQGLTCLAFPPPGRAARPGCSRHCDCSRLAFHLPQEQVRPGGLTPPSGSVLSLGKGHCGYLTLSSGPDQAGTQVRCMCVRGGGGVIGGHWQPRRGIVSNRLLLWIQWTGKGLSQKICHSSGVKCGAS